MRDAARAIEFYKEALGATELYRMLGPDKKQVMHAEIRIGDSIVMLADEFPQMQIVSPLALKGSAVFIHVYHENIDALFEQAKKAGAEVMVPPMDMFWGDRFGKLKDPFGHLWSVSTHQWDMTPEEMQKASDEAMKNAKGF